MRFRRFCRSTPSHPAQKFALARVHQVAVVVSSSSFMRRNSGEGQERRPYRTYTTLGAGRLSCHAPPIPSQHRAPDA